VGLCALKAVIKNVPNSLHDKKESHCFENFTVKLRAKMKCVL